MRFFLSILFLFTSCFLNAQEQVIINGSGNNITINNGSPTSSITINLPASTIASAVSKQQINLSWPTHVGATRYIIEQATASDFSDAQQVFAGNELSYAATGLTQNTTYYYRYSWSNDATTNNVFDTKSATTLNEGVTYDIDAEATIAALEASVTVPTQIKEDINTYVTAAKSFSLWNKFYTQHYGVTGSWIANSINWYNPDFNNIEGFPELYSGAITHSNGKISFAGVGASSELTATRAFSTNWIVPSSYLSLDNKAYSFNITDAPTTGSQSDSYRFGNSTTSPAYGDQLTIIGLPNGVPTNDEARISGANVTGTNFMNTNVPGFYTYQRSSALSGGVLLRKNGSDILTSLNASTGQTSIPIGTGGYFSNAPVPNSLSYRTYGRNMFSVHQSFDATEMANWETISGNLLTALTAHTWTPIASPSTTGRFVWFFGDSFTQWPSAGTTSGERGWWVRVGQRFHILPRTSGSGGIGYYSQTNACYAALETPTLDRMGVLIGYNDVKVFGTAPTGIEHGKSGIRAMLVNHFLATAVAASDAAVTKTGTWANPALASSKADNIGGNELQSATSGDKISYVFSGDNVVIGVCNADGTTVTYGSVAITVDGNSQGSYSANFKAYNVTSSGGRIWNAIILKGYGVGSHTVELTLESSVNFVVDYFGTLQDPDDCFPVTIGDIQYDNTGTVNRNANADNLTQEIKTMIAADFPEYVNKISYPATNTFYDASDPTQVSGDNVHPTDKGYKFIFRSVERVWIE